MNNTLRTLLEAARTAINAHRNDIYFEPWEDATGEQARVDAAVQSIDNLEKAVEAFEAAHIDDGART